MYSSLLLSLSPGTRNWRANFVSRPLAIERSFLVKAITIQFDRLSASRMKTKSNSWLVSLFAPYFCGSFRFGSIDVFNYSVSASFLYFVAFEMFGLTNEMSKLPQSSLIRIDRSLHTHLLLRRKLASQFFSSFFTRRCNMFDIPDALLISAQWIDTLNRMDCKLPRQ